MQRAARCRVAEDVIRAVLDAMGPRPVNDTPVQIVGRAGSLFTRLPRIFAEELGVAYELVQVEDLAAMEPSAYAGNPALRMPALRDGHAVLFGAQNVCRAIAERAATPARIVWPEDVRDVLSRNAQELVSHAMAARVQLLMGMDVGELPADNVFFVKARAGLEGALGWLDAHLGEVLSALPEPRSLSFFEVSLYCLIEHLEFGPTVPIARHGSLLAFARPFGTRASAQRTAFR